MKYLFFLLLPLAYLAGNVYLFFRGKAAFAAQSTGVKVLLLIIFLCCALAFFGAFFLRELHLPATMAQLIEQVGTGWLVFTLYMVIALLLLDLLKICHLYSCQNEMCDFSKRNVIFCSTLKRLNGCTDEP